MACIPTTRRRSTARLPDEPARPADALAYPYRLVVQPGVDAFELREALFPAGPEVTVEIRNGHDGAEPGPADYAAGLARLGEIDDIAIVAAPGHSVLTAATYQTVQSALAAHAQDSGFRIAVLDPERGLDLAGIRSTRGRVDNSCAALYWPWVIIANPLARPGREDIPREIALPPSGHVCGIYARNDVLRGVHKAPANEVVRQAALRGRGPDRPPGGAQPDRGELPALPHRPRFPRLGRAARELGPRGRLRQRPALPAKRNVTNTLQDETHERDVQKGILINAFPMKYTGPTLAAKGGTDVAMEELVVAYEAMRFEQVET